MALNENDGLLSVIVPIYNSKDYLSICIDSIQNQLYSNLQIILVDDGSTDGSGEICDRYARKDQRIEVIHIQNSGNVYARKIGIERARGEYIGFVDSDDYIGIDMFENLVNAMEETGADFVHSGYIEIKGDKKAVKSLFEYSLFDLNDRKDSVEFLRKYFLDIKTENTISYSLWSKLFKRELIYKCFLKINDKQLIGEDAINLCRCILESKRVLLIPSSSYYYVVRDKSLSHKEGYEAVSKRIILCNEFLNVMREYELDTDLNKDIFGFISSTLMPYIKNVYYDDSVIRQFYISNCHSLEGKKTIVYGAGNVGKDYIIQLKCANKVEVICWSDKRFKGIEEIDGILRVEPCRISEFVFDIIIIACDDELIAAEIKKELTVFGIEEKKIEWEKPNRFF